MCVCVCVCSIEGPSRFICIPWKFMFLFVTYKTNIVWKCIKKIIRDQRYVCVGVCDFRLCSFLLFCWRFFAYCSLFSLVLTKTPLTLPLVIIEQTKSFIFLVVDFFLDFFVCFFSTKFLLYYSIFKLFSIEYNDLSWRFLSNLFF